jgi:polysaccharide biosynthesis protein PslJ
VSLAVPRRRSILPAAAVCSAIALLAVGVLSGVSMRATAGLLILVTACALVRPAFVSWPRMIAALVLIILFIPIRRYALPATLPFQLEPYRLFVALLVVVWAASLLVDPRTRLRRTGFEGPLVIIVGSAFASIVANPGRVQAVSSEVDKKLMFFLSFVLVLYITASVIRRLDNIDYLTKTLAGGGAVVAFFALIEARTGFNIFNHLTRVIPLLHWTTDDLSGPDMKRFGSAKLRVFASAQHPIALSAMFVMLTPLAIYLAHRTRQKRWMLAAFLLAAACASTVSRTGIMMFVVVIIVFLWLRPRETRRLWPAIFPALIVIHFALPGTIGALKNSFLPTGGLVAEQQSDAGQVGSGRLADLGPAMTEYKATPLLGQGFGTRVVDPAAPTPLEANILDDQWLGTLLETGAIGVFGWLWFFVRVIRRFGAEAKQDDSARGWLLAGIAAGVAAFAVGMLTYDAFSFIQVTFLLFIFVGLGSALIAERPTPLAVRTKRDQQASRSLAVEYTA